MVYVTHSGTSKYLDNIYLGVLGAPGPRAGTLSDTPIDAGCRKKVRRAETPDLHSLTAFLQTALGISFGPFVWAVTFFKGM